MKMLPERTNTGLALSAVEEAGLLDAIGQSPSPSLYPFFVLSLDAGLRPSERVHCGSAISTLFGRTA